MKELHVATDIYDEIHHTGRFYSQKDLQDLARYCRSLGATTMEWIMDDVWTLYEDYPGGFDLLSTAVEAAHSAGLEFHVVYKPFEGVLSHLVLPQTFPRPPGSIVWEDLRGLLPIVRPFVAANPELCFQRRPGDEDPGGDIATIRLVSDEDTPTGLTAADLGIWTGTVNGSFLEYHGPRDLEETSAWRPLFPMGRTCRIVTLKNLAIPEGARYIEVRLAEAALRDRPFQNEYNAILELANAAGQTIPATPGPAHRQCERCCHELAKPFMSRLVRHTRLPEVAAVLSDPSRITNHAAEMRGYASLPGTHHYPLHEFRRVATARGKIQHLPGVLNPVYPEVEEWLHTVQFCIDRGVDGVDFRPSYHLRPQEGRAYGFNPPVREEMNDVGSTAEVAHIIGNAYTGFLREARELLHANGRRLGVHVISTFLQPNDESRRPPTTENLEHQWQTWVGEIADYAVFRGAMGFRETGLRSVVDRFALACRQADIPFIYQSNRRPFDARRDALHLDPNRLKWLEYEMRYALGHPGVHAYQLYETANFTRLDEAGNLEGSEEIRELAQGFQFAGRVNS